jgi:hypothetical protein
MKLPRRIAPGITLFDQPNSEDMELKRTPTTPGPNATLVKLTNPVAAMMTHP